MILETINSPADVKCLSEEQTATLCRELRCFLVEQVSRTGGHLASNLGVVELTVAIHRVFDTATDRLVLDVGHQCYVHKALTGRRELFDTLRQFGGLSGFPKPYESVHDAFMAGHASDSVSVALGMARARTLLGQDYHVVAVIGDGALGGGLSFEGLNNAGASKQTNLLVILNDNNMAIDQATGALKNYLVKISTSRRYNAIKRRLWRILSHTPAVLRFCQKAGNAVKQGLLKNSNLFESLNFRYFGPIDGHNLPELVRVLTALQRIEGPKLLHVMTVKGKGYKPAECNKPVWHAPGKFNPETGERIVSKDEHNAVKAEQEIISERLDVLERRMETVPDGKTLHNIQLSLEELRGDMKAIGDNARHAVGQLDEYSDERDAGALFRRRYRRRTCRDFLRRTGGCGHGAFLQHLFEFHAAGL